MRRVVVLGHIGPTDGNMDGPSHYRSAPWFWLVREHEGIQFWVHNLDGSSLTTGTVVDWTSFITGEWQND